MKRSRKIVIVIGTTAVGKSKLGLQLAQRMHPGSKIHEIVNADSMQIYDRLDLMSAKVTPEEIGSVPHHLLSSVSFKTPWTIQDFNTAAIQEIDNVLDRDRIPIIVGGTFYYVESLLWDTLVNSTEWKEVSNQKERKEYVDSLRESTQSVHDILKQVDPLMANRFHPNELRRIERSLEVYISSGKRHSDLILETGGIRGTSETNLLRYDPCIIWLDCQKDVIHERIDQRVDRMLEDGLIHELKEFHQEFNRLENDVKESIQNKGVLQAIGYKEFLPYLNLDTNKELEHALTLTQCTEKLKIATRQYAKAQLKWIRNRLQGPRGESILNNVFRLDTSNIENWDENVLIPSLEICHKFFDESESNPLPSTYNHLSEGLPKIISSKFVDTNSVEKWQNGYCEQCERTLYGLQEIDVHFRSRKHKKRVAKIANDAKIAKYFKDRHMDGPRNKE